MKRKKSLTSIQRKYGYFFTFPFVIGAIFFIIYPFILTVIFSFSKVGASEAGRTLDWIGIENYRYILAVDPDYRKKVVSTLASTFTSVPVVIIFSFFLASLLNQQFKGRSVVRAVLFLPLIISSPLLQHMMSIDQISSNVSSQASSAVNIPDLAATFAESLEKMGLSDSIVSLLTGSINNISNLLAMSAIPIILFLAGLQSVSPSIYEASYVEGATAWEVFWKISLPMISPIILVTIIYCIIDSFVSSSNSVIGAVRTVCYTDMNFGRASAMAWVYLLIVAVLIAVIYKIVDHFVFYYD